MTESVATSPTILVAGGGIAVMTAALEAADRGIAGESFENPVHLDKPVETVGGEPLPDYDNKVACCGGRWRSRNPRKAKARSRTSSSRRPTMGRT